MSCETVSHSHSRFLFAAQVHNLVKHAASPPAESCPAPSALHSPPASAAPESPLTSADLPPNKAPSSLPADLAPCERLLDFSMGGSPHALGLPVSAPPQFHWVFITKTNQTGCCFSCSTYQFCATILKLILVNVKLGLVLVTF